MRGRHRPGFYSLAAKCDKTKAFEIGSRRSTFTLFRYVRGAAYQGLSRHNGQSSLRDARRSARPGRRLATRSDAARCDMVWHGLARFGTVWHPKALLAGRFALSAVRFALAAWQRWRRVATLAARGNAGGAWQRWRRIPQNECPLPALPARDLVALQGISASSRRKQARSSLGVCASRAQFNQSIHFALFSKGQIKSICAYFMVAARFKSPCHSMPESDTDLVRLRARDRS